MNRCDVTFSGVQIESVIDVITQDSNNVPKDYKTGGSTILSVLTSKHLFLRMVLETETILSKPTLHVELVVLVPHTLSTKRKTKAL